jgi:hypothetical protein
MIMEHYQKTLVDFCAYYMGPKLCINTRNVGHSFSQVVHTRGGNRVLHSIRVLYSNDAFEKEVENIQTYEHAEVCKEVAAMLSISSTLRYGAEHRHIGLVGKLSVSRWDRDESEAYISIDEQLYHIKLHALNIEDYLMVHKETNIPLIEDYAICQTIMSILTHGIESMPELGNGFLKKINLREK